MRSLVVGLGIVALVGCGGGGHATPDGGGGDGSGHGYTRTTDGPIYCLVSADCPDGEHCELGACRSGCTTDADCPGQTCGPRGRCVETADQDLDTSPPPTKPAELSISPERAILEPGVGQVSLTLTATPAAAVTYRLQPRVPWLKVADNFGQFDGSSTTVTVNVDRNLAGPGTHVGQVGVISSVGNAVFEVTFSEGLTGRYVGTIEVTQPRPISKTQFGLDLQEDGGFVDALVRDDRSLLFPLLKSGGLSQPVVGNGRMTNGTLSLTFETLVPAETLLAAGVPASDSLCGNAGTSGNPFGRDIGREITLTLTPGEGGNLSGAFDEKIYGIFPDPIDVKGTVQLVRVGLQAGETISVPPAPTVNLPSSPNTSPPAVEARCWDVTCHSGAAGSTLLGCATIRATAAYKLTAQWQAAPPTGSRDPSWPAILSDLADKCADGTQGTDTFCFDQATHDCAVELAFLADQRGASGTGAAILEMLDQRDTLHSFVANEYMVRAFGSRLGINQDAPGECGHTQLAINFYRSALQQLDRAYALDFLTYVPGSDLVASEYGALKRMARATSGIARATAQRSLLDLRFATSATDRDIIRKRLQVSALMGHLQAATAARILQLRQGPEVPDLGMIAASLGELGQVFRSLTTELNALGFTPQYVPFAAKDPSPTASTNNFRLIAAQATPLVETAKTKEATAVTGWRDFETEQSRLASEHTTLVGNLDVQLKGFCGTTTDGKPDLDNCDTNVLGQVYGVIVALGTEQTAMGVAKQRMDGQGEKIAVEVDRAARIRQVRAETIAFLDEQGQQATALDMQMAAVTAAQKFIDIASRADLWNAGAPLVEATIMAGLELVRGGLEQQKTQLAYAEKIHAEAAQSEIEYINSMALVKTMLIDLVTMSLEVGLAAQKVLEAELKVLAIRNQKDAIVAQRDATQAMLAGSFANDPSWRVLRDSTTLEAFDTFEIAMQKVYLAARALEYETNMPFPPLQNQFFAIRSAAKLGLFLECLGTNMDNFGNAYSSPQTYAQVVSLREDVLGIKEPITDPVTGQTLSPAEQFRRMLLSPAYLDDRGGTGFEFSTNLGTDGLFSSLVCNDRIVQIRAKLVGDFLGDNQVQLEISQRGASFVRSCRSDSNNDIVVEYKLDSMPSQPQAGVNDWGQAPPNTTLASRSVAAARWIVRIPGGSEAPMNRDVKLDSIDDIVIELTHSAIPLGSQNSNPYNPQTCPLGT